METCFNTLMQRVLYHLKGPTCDVPVILKITDLDESSEYQTTGIVRNVVSCEYGYFRVKYYVGVPGNPLNIRSWYCDPDCGSMTVVGVRMGFHRSHRCIVIDLLDEPPHDMGYYDTRGYRYRPNTRIDFPIPVSIYG